MDGTWGRPTGQRWPAIHSVILGTRYRQRGVCRISQVIHRSTTRPNINRHRQPLLPPTQAYRLHTLSLSLPISFSCTLLPESTGKLHSRSMFFRRRKDGAGCSSAGRVTAKLLLSFLAVSATPACAGNNKQINQQAVLPYDPVPLTPLKPEAPSPAEHTFVSTTHLRHLSTEAAANRLSFALDPPTGIPPWNEQIPSPPPKDGRSKQPSRGMARGRRRLCEDEYTATQSQEQRREDRAAGGQET